LPTFTYFIYLKAFRLLELTLIEIYSDFFGLPRLFDFTGFFGASSTAGAITSAFSFFGAAAFFATGPT
jgi:hypothetical protein